MSNLDVSVQLRLLDALSGATQKPIAALMQISQATPAWRAMGRPPPRR